VHQDFTEDALTEAMHPTDGKMRPVKKVFLPVGITFKGGGFYKTDSGKSGASVPSSTSDTSTSSTSASDSTSSAASTTPSTPSTD
jgi:predicted nucleic acid-binding Zn ribbon protein